MNHKYIPHTDSDIKEMLEKVKVSSIDGLFKEVPEEVKINKDYHLSAGLSEIEVENKLNDLSNMNNKDLVCFIGAGSYDHYIPSIIKHITSRSEFYTAYTPYQPEVSQGTLQYIFEFQTMMTDLTNMEVCNASMYDGATSCAESIMMAVSKTRRKKVLVSKALHPYTIETIKTYGHFNGYEIIMLENEAGLLDEKDLENKLNKEIACVVVSNPNFYGLIENPSNYVEKIHDNKSLLIMYVNPLSLGLLKTPGEIGADIVCGEAQPLGIALCYGGPYIGYICTTKKYIRNIPGRIVGQTTDEDGKRAFVLTLQAREQHIRRQRASSNICSNQSLNALAATVYMSVMGKQGLVDVCEQNVQKAHYAYEQITSLKTFEKVFDTPFFNEFLVKSTIDYKIIKEALLKENMIAGIHLGEFDSQYNNHIVFCVTEKRTKAEIDQLVQVLGGLK
ncbi:aminomethyl-transferring glycine dehydrogenase subunit GcvPA [Mycoplasmatota bacterium]|nr:aminomethyl-transferring glycine dehydrogenase subunit GcvPA [Mycoplasmatota bacterium]